MKVPDSIAAGLERPPQPDRGELKKAAAEFEALFLNQMLTTMRATVDKGDLFHGGAGEEIYTSLLDVELSRSLAQAGGIGLAEMLLRQISPSEAGAPLPEPGAGRMLAPERNAPMGAPQRQPVDRDAQAPFVFPVKEPRRVSSEFGDRVDPITGQTRFHHGIDIAASKGTPVFPAAPGTVVFSGERGGYGNLVEVLHDNGYVTRYGHNEKNLAKEGDRVGPSEPIARVGSTGRSTGPHLHFEVLMNGSAINPYTLYG